MNDNYYGTLQRLRALAAKQDSLAPAPELKQTRGFMERPNTMRETTQRTQSRVAPTPYDPNEVAAKAIKKIQELSAAKRAAQQAEQEEAPAAEVEPVEDRPLGIPQTAERIDPRQVVGNIASTITAFASPPKSVAEDKAFLSEVNAVSGRLGIKPEALMALMSFETGGSFDPAIVNQAGSGATGLIQFMPATAKSLGTSVEELRKMSRAQQMKYVEKYLSQFNVKGASPEDLYMAVLYPKAVGKPNDYGLFRRGTKAYEQNAGLDLDRDGLVTKGEAAKRAFS